MGRHEEALSVLRRAARMNGTKLPPTDHLLAIMKNITQQVRKRERDRFKNEI